MEPLDAFEAFVLSTKAAWLTSPEKIEAAMVVPDISAMIGKPYLDPNPSEDAIRRSQPFQPLLPTAEGDLEC